MNIVIEIGNPSPDKNEVYDFSFLDDIKSQYEKNEKLLTSSNCIRISNADHFLLYIANNLLLRYIVSQKDNTPKEIKDLPNLNPDNVKIYEQYDDHVVNLMGEKDGLITRNYYDDLMKLVMNDFYKSINYL